MKKYRDYWGLLAQADADCGDTAQRTGSLYALLGAMNAAIDDRDKLTVEGFLYDLDKLRVRAGRYVRHPVHNYPKNGRYSPWWGNPDNFSRDQSVILQSAMVILGTKKEMLELYQVRKANKFLHFNTESYDDAEPITTKFPDLPSPIEAAQFIRGLDLWYARPLLYILDAQLLLDLIFRKLNKRNQYDTDNMMLPVMFSCLHKWPTWVGKLARRLYARTDAVSRVKAYYSELDGNNGLEPMGELYEQAFNKLIRKDK